MPKQNLILNDFSGGMNQEVNPEDIDNNQFSTLIDADITRKGSIRLMGKSARYTDVTSKAVTVMPGYGLFPFSSDYSFASTPVEEATPCLVLQDENDYHIWDGTSWISTDKDSNTLQLGATPTTSVYPSYYYVDGALRISDIENTTNTNKWFGHSIVQQLGIGSNGWYQEDQEIKAPTAGIVGDLNLTATGLNFTLLQDTTGDFSQYEGHLVNKQLACNLSDDTASLITTYNTSIQITTATAPTTWTGKKVLLAPVEGLGFNLDFDTDNGGDWEAGTYETACTFIYDGDQESLPYIMGGQFTTASGDLLDLKIIATGTYSPRLKGGRVYCRIANSSNEWVLISDISLEYGARGSLSGDYTAWIDADDWIGSEMVKSSAFKVSSPNIDSYEMLTGVNQDEESIYAEYTTSAITNRRAYIGNVKVDGVRYGDRILRSPVSKFDTFPGTSILDVAIGDGDEIVHMEATGDKLLVFKKKKLFVINVSQEYEIIEAEFSHRGVDFACSVCKTPYGICFVNSFGAFLYDGTKLIELSKQISYSFQSLYDIDWRPAVGYDPTSDSIIMIDGATATGTKDSYVFSFKHSAWLYVGEMFPDSLQTNFVEYDDNLVTHNLSGNGVYNFDPAPQATDGFYAVTKSFDFGDPFREKKVYEIFVKHSGNSTPNVNVILTDGTATTTLGVLTHTFLVYNTVDKFTYSGNPLNHAQLKLTADGTVPSDFMIDAIGITYRIKGVSKNV